MIFKQSVAPMLTSLAGAATGLCRGLAGINWPSKRNLIFEKDFRQETLVAIFQWMMMSIFGSMKIELRNHESISKCFVLGK